MRKLLLFIASTTAAFGASFTIAPGAHHFGAGAGILNSTVTVSLTGSGSGSAFVYFTMAGNLNISLPPGVSGTCTGAPCNIFTADSANATGYFNPGGSAFPTSTIQALSFAVDAVFSTSPTGANPVTALDDASLYQFGGPNTFELGSKIYADANGYITAIRFNKPPTDGSATHKVSLWDLSGNLLSSATSTSESASGWQTVPLPSSVAITANTGYIVSYYTTGPFWFNGGLLQNRNYGSGLLHLVASYTASNGSCNYGDAWPQDASGRSAAGEVSCIQISNGAIGNIQGGDAGSSSYASEGCQCMIGGLGPGPYKFQNNYLSAVGLPWHHDDSGVNYATRTDYTYWHNTFHVPLSRMFGHPTSDGMRYMHRQALEWKSGQRISLFGNIFDGSWVEDNPVGVAVTITSVNGQGTTDVNVESNTFKHVAGIMGSPSIVEGGAPVTRPTARFRFANNLAYDVNGKMTYWVNAGFAPPPGWVLAGPTGSEDVIVDHNSIIGNVGRVSSVLHLFQTKTEGVQVTNNVLYFSGGNNGLTIDGGMNNPVCGGTGKVLADCMFTNYRWDHNLFLGDTSQSTIANYWPGLQNYIPSDPTNLSAAGWYSLNQDNYRFRSNYCSGCGHPASDLRDVGVDVDKLEADQGAVNLIGVPNSAVTTTSAAVVFVAPDAQACSVDYSTTDPNVVTSFTRVADNGTGRNRSVSLTGLTSKTVYYYRVNCAVQQPTGQFLTH